MSVGGRTTFVPFQLPPGSDSTTASGQFFLFTAGGNANITVDVIGANGVSIPAGHGVVAVTGAAPGVTDKIFPGANLFNVASIGMVRFTTTDIVNFQVVLVLNAFTAFATVDVAQNYPASEAADGTFFVIVPQPNAPSIIVSNPTSGVVQFQAGSAPVQSLPALSTVAVSTGRNSTQTIRVTSGTALAVSYAASSVPALA